VRRRLFDEFLGEVIAKSGTQARPYPDVLEQLERKDSK
jgi:hypothetical protein